MPKVLVVGRATIDLNPLETNVPLDKAITFKKYVGGSACNTAIGLSRLGVETSILTRLSTDQFGKCIEIYLNNEKINTELVQYDDNAKTGLTFTEIKSPTESSILMYRDEVADLNLDISTICANQIENFDYVLISGTSLSSYKSRAAVLKVVDICEDNDIPLIFDIDYRPYTWENNDYLDFYCCNIAKKAFIIIGSEEEFRLMRTITKEKSNEEVANYFLHKKAEHVVIKRGSKGSTYYSSNEKYKVQIFPVNLLKSFGGGDAYVSTFVSGIINGEELEETLLKSTAHAAMLVSSHSCSEALATNTEIEAFIATAKVDKQKIIERIL